MRRTSSLAALAFALLAVAAHAQVAIYGTFSALHVSNVQTGAVYSGSSYQNQTTSFWAPGLGGGVTLNFLHLGPASLGFDFRGSTKPGTTGADTALGGLKLGFKAPLLPLQPYLQGSAGYLATRTPNVSTGSPAGSTFTNKYAAFELIGGVDLPIAPFFDLRLLEVGAGRGFHIGLGSGSYNPTLFTVNSGLVFHF
ncbi:MAG: hypothetical protein NVSMB3_08840 [Acidobacteriaceae bacterium]